MTAPLLEILAYETTPLGPLCLRRRNTRHEPPQRVTEITLNHEFLMSSLHTDSERALAEIPLAHLPGNDLSVLIGGLGLGYTADAALASERVSRVLVVEFLPQIIQWLADGLIPLAAGLNADPRLAIVEGDVYARLLSVPTPEPFDLILVDVDHSPADPLAASNAPFYTTAGMALARQHLQPGGILALWSCAEHTPTLEAMRRELTDVAAHPIRYYNRHVDEEFTDWIYTGRRPGIVTRP
jgi:spermidine synthase